MADNVFIYMTVFGEKGCYEKEVEVQTPPKYCQPEVVAYSCV